MPPNPPEGGLITQLCSVTELFKIPHRGILGGIQGRVTNFIKKNQKTIKYFHVMSDPNNDY